MVAPDLIDPGRHSDFSHVLRTLHDAGAFRDAAVGEANLVRDAATGHHLSAVRDGMQMAYDAVNDSHEATGLNKALHQEMNYHVLPEAQEKVDREQQRLDKEQAAIDGQRAGLESRQADLDKEKGALAQDRSLSQQERDQRWNDLNTRQVDLDHQREVLDGQQHTLDGRQTQLDQIQTNIDSWPGFNGREARNEHEDRALEHADARRDHEETAQEDSRRQTQDRRILEQQTEVMEQHRAEGPAVDQRGGDASAGHGHDPPAPAQGEEHELSR